MIAKIIAITNQKGGVGKTTTTVNLAAGLGLHDKKVLVIDIDAQGNATQGLGIDKNELEKQQQTTYDMMLNYTKDLKAYVMKTEFTNVDIVGASHSLVAFETNYSGKEQKELVLKKCLMKLKQDYDYILIDCPPSLNVITLNGLAATDSVMIPVQSEFYALEGMTQLLNTINICKNRLNKKLKIEGILLTMYISNTNLSSSVREEIEKYFSNYMYKTVIRRSVSIAEAPSYGLPIMYYKKTSNGSFDYLKLTREVIQNG